MKAFNLCIVGGGSTFTLGFLKSFVRLREEFPLKKLVLFDIDAERQEPIGKYGEILFRERFPELDFHIPPTAGKRTRAWILCSCRCAQAGFPCVPRTSIYR